MEDDLVEYFLKSAKSEFERELKVTNKRQSEVVIKLTNM
jgi:hypothetical protein